MVLFSGYGSISINIGFDIIGILLLLDQWILCEQMIGELIMLDIVWE